MYIQRGRLERMAVVEWTEQLTLLLYASESSSSSLDSPFRRSTIVGSAAAMLASLLLQLLLNLLTGKDKGTYSQHRYLTALQPWGKCSSPFTWPWAGSELQTQLSYVGGRPHLSHILPLPSKLLGRYQIILLSDRGTWTTCPELLPDSETAKNIFAVHPNV